MLQIGVMALLCRRFFLPLVLGCCLAGRAHAEVLVVQGSDTLGSRAVPRLIEAFNRIDPSVSFEFSSEGTTPGLRALVEGAVHIAMASRAPTPEEVAAAEAQGVVLEPITVAYDGIALVVHADNPLMGLSLPQIEAIFTGDVRDWSGVRGVPGPISPYARNSSSGTYSSFRELALGARDYSPRTMLLAGHEQVAREVAANRQGIGYVGLGFLDTPGVHVLEIDGSPPAQDEILRGAYPLARPLFLVVDRQRPRDAVASFLLFALSTEGQAIIAESDFVPVRPQQTRPPEAVLQETPAP